MTIEKIGLNGFLRKNPIANEPRNLYDIGQPSIPLDAPERQHPAWASAYDATFDPSFPKILTETVKENIEAGMPEMEAEKEALELARKRADEVACKDAYKAVTGQEYEKNTRVDDPKDFHSWEEHALYTVKG